MFFRRALPFKISIDWRQRRLKNNFKVSQPKNGYLKIAQRGDRSDGGRIPEGGGGIGLELLIHSSNFLAWSIKSADMPGPRQVRWLRVLWQSHQKS